MSRWLSGTVTLVLLGGLVALAALTLYSQPDVLLLPPTQPPPAAPTPAAPTLAAPTLAAPTLAAPTLAAPTLAAAAAGEVPDPGQGMAQTGDLPEKRTVRPLAWAAVTDGNWMNNAVVAGETLWIASDGGALAWPQGEPQPTLFTVLEGLSANRLTAVVNCELPGWGVVFGSSDGLQIWEPERRGWRSLHSRSGELSDDTVTALACDAATGQLAVGYARQGIDLFDAAAGEWRHLDRSSGLASNNVRALALAGQAVWVVADDGITVAAGMDSTFYNSSNSPLESNRVGSIVVDPAGTVWLGGDGVLYAVAGEDWTVYRTAEIDDRFFPDRLISGLAVAADGELWLGDSEGRLCRFDPAAGRCSAGVFLPDTVDSSSPQLLLTSLTVAADEQLYVTTAGAGLFRYDGRSWAQLSVAESALYGNAVGAATVSPAGALWVATQAGIQQLDPAGRAVPVLLPPSGLDPATLQVLYEARNGALWAGGAGAGVWDGQAWRRFTAEEGLAGSRVQAIAEDALGRIWLGTETGISIWNGVRFVNLTRSTGLPVADIRALLADEESVWIGSAGGGLYRFAQNQIEVFTVENMGLPSDTITALGKDADGRLYVGTLAGLVEWGTDGLAVALAEHPVTQIAATAHALWVGTADAGLFYADGAGWQQENPDGLLPFGRVVVLAAAQESLWVGGASGGLLRLPLSAEEESNDVRSTAKRADL